MKPAGPHYDSEVFAAWESGSQANWIAYTHHAFVNGLADGSLPKAAFIHYLIQDYVFLVHFSRAWAMAIVKADTVEEMRLAAGTVNALVNEEMQLHISTCAAEGISENDLFNAAEAPANLAYTRYVMDAGLSGDFVDLLAALSPCVFGYGQIGHRLGASRVADNPYQSWIDTYAGDDYQQVCRDVAGLLESAVARRLGSDPTNNPRWPRLQHRFDTATRLEADFWQMGLNAGSAQG